MRLWEAWNLARMTTLGRVAWAGITTLGRVAQAREARKPGKPRSRTWYTGKVAGGGV